MFLCNDGVNNLILITSNISDYGDFKELRLQNWHVKN